MYVVDNINGPEWVMILACILLFIIGIVLVSGHGSFMIAGYNTAPKKKKELYDEKKLCRSTGIAAFIIALMVLIMYILRYTLPAYFIYIFVALTLITVIVNVIYINKFCKTV